MNNVITQNSCPICVPALFGLTKGRSARKWTCWSKGIHTSATSLQYSHTTLFMSVLKEQKV